MGRKLLFLCVCFQLYCCFQARKSKRPLNYGTCDRDKYLCENQKCISKNLFCDGTDNCGDYSDEAFCMVNKGNRLPEHFGRFWCDHEWPSRYIPQVWRCDGVVDCVKSKRDELEDCETFEITLLDDVEHVDGSISARQKAARWLKNQRQNVSGTNKWGIHASRTAVALYLADPTYFGRTNIIGNELAYEIDSQVLLRMIRVKAETAPVSFNELALYIHALLVTCANPRDFHGVNLLEKLRREVDREQYVSPFVLLSLCNANDQMTTTDIDKLAYASKLKRRASWTSTQALVLMALSCIAKQPQGPYVNSSIIEDMSANLKRHQRNNGSFENKYTTALVMQALFASDTEDEGGWNMTHAVKFLINSQNEDGSYGNLLNTYFVLPVLHYKSLANISSAHCPAKTTNDSVDVLEELGFKIGIRMYVKYTLWIGDNIDLAYSLKIRVLENMTVFDIMKVAKALDKKYDFKYTLMDSKPYIYWLAGYQDNPENEKFWFLYKTTTGFGTAPIDSSPVDVVMKDKDEYIMWYRSGHWMQNGQLLLAGATPQL